MCAPMLALGVGLGVQAIGGIYSAQQANQAGKSQQAYYNYVAAQNRAQAEAVRKAADKQSIFIQDSAAIENAQLGRSAAQLASTQKASLTANGVDLSSGTAADIAADTHDKRKLDEIMIRRNADLKSYSAITQGDFDAKDLENQSQLNIMAGQNARKAGKVAAVSTLIGTAGQVAGGYYNAKYGNLARIK